MDLAFATIALRDLCLSEVSMVEHLGDEKAEALKVLVADLRAATSISDVVSGEIAVSKANHRDVATYISPQGIRVSMLANHRANPVDDLGVVDWSLVTRIKITEVS